MSLHLGTQKLHDIAECKLVNVDNFLPNLGQVDGGCMPAAAATTLTPAVADAEHAVLLLAAFRANKIGRHYEIAWVNADRACVFHGSLDDHTTSEAKAKIAINRRDI